MVSENNDAEINADIEFVDQYFRKFLEDFTENNNYLPEITEPIITTYGAKPKSILAVMVYAFTAGMNVGAEIIGE